MPILEERPTACAAHWYITASRRIMSTSAYNTDREVIDENENKNS
jgi:hypothetical protein